MTTTQNRQTVPDAILDKISDHRPHLATMIANARAGKVPWRQAEKALAQAYTLGASCLTATEAHKLAACAEGKPYGQTVTAR